MDCTRNGPFLGNCHLGKSAGAARDIKKEKVKEESQKGRKTKGEVFHIRAIASHVRNGRDKVVML